MIANILIVRSAETWKRRRRKQDSKALAVEIKLELVASGESQEEAVIILDLRYQVICCGQYHTA